MKPHRLSLFIFRRDLRLEDNTGLIQALKSSDQVIPCFIFDARQITPHDYFSEIGFAFLLQSLVELNDALVKYKSHLYFFSGIAENVVHDLLLSLPIDAVYFNRDYTPFSQRRDDAILRVTHQMDRRCYRYEDALLHEPEEVMKNDGTPYVIFTPFMRRAMQLPLQKSTRNALHHYYSDSIPNASSALLETYLTQYQHKINPNDAGRKAGIQLLHRAKTLKNYAENRNYPALDCTTHLSVHLKFGTISPREAHRVFEKCDTPQSLMSELFWRDFLTHIAFHFPFVFKEAYREKYRQACWSNNRTDFEKWCQGKTGVPIVDAGMHQLNETGYMHNRVRMLTASYLVKNLNINWQWGEKYFAQRLMDYDPAVNNGNWQWIASCGADAQPPYRVFNPTLQQKKFDSNGEYVRRWLIGGGAQSAF